MYSEERFIVYPEGDIQEINHNLTINQLVDLNGEPLVIPIYTNKMIAYRVTKISRKESKGGSATYHYLELVSVDELSEYL